MPQPYTENYRQPGSAESERQSTPGKSTPRGYPASSDRPSENKNILFRREEFLHLKGW